MFMFCPNLAKSLKSADKAFMVEYIAFMVDHNRRNEEIACYKNGHFYTPMTLDSWERLMPWLSRATVRRYLEDLRGADLMHTARLGAAPTDATLYYTLNVSMVRSRGWSSHLGGVDNTDRVKMNTSDLSKVSPPPARAYTMNTVPCRVQPRTHSSSMSHGIHEKKKELNSRVEEREDYSSIIQSARVDASTKPADGTQSQIPKVSPTRKPEPIPTNSNSSKSNKNPPPLRDQTLAEQWHRWTRETTRAVAFSLPQISAGISEMQAVNNLSNEELWAIFEHIQQSPFFKQRMLSPNDWSRKCGHTNNLEALRIEISGKKKKIENAKPRDGKEVNTMQDLIDKCF